MARPGQSQLLEALRNLSPEDKAQVTYEQIKQAPGYEAFSDKERDEVFRMFQPGASDQLKGSDLRTTRGTYDAEVSPQVQPPGQRTADLAISAQGPAPEGPAPGGGFVQDVLLPGAATAAAAQAGRMGGAALGGLAGPIGAGVGAVVGGMGGAGLAEYGRQRVMGEPLDVGGIAIAAGSEALGPAIWKGLGGVGRIFKRRASQVARAGQEAAEEVRPALTGQLAAQAVPERKLFNAFDAAIQQNPPAIPTPNIQQGLQQVSARFPNLAGLGSQNSNLGLLHQTTTNLKAVLSYRDPITGRILPPARVKGTINELYERIKVLDEDILSLPEGSPARANMEYIRGTIMRDIDAYAKTPGAHAAAPLLIAANRAHVARLAATRIGELINRVLYDPSVAYGKKEATNLAKRLRADKTLPHYFKDPAELEAIIEAAIRIGEKSPKALPRIRGAGALGTIVGGATAGMGGMMLPGSEVSRGGAPNVGDIVEGAVRGYALGTVGLMTPEIVREAAKVTMTPRGRLLLSAITHNARLGIVGTRRQEEERAGIRRQPAGTGSLPVR